jgi:Zn-dependent protease
VGRSFLIGRVKGVAIRVHWALLIVLPLLFLYQPLVHLGRHPQGAEWLLDNVVQMLCLLGAVVVHESAHALFGGRLGARVHEIVLWPLGGFTRLSSLPPRPSAQVMLSLSGPFTNLLLAGAAFVVLQGAPAARPVAHVLWWNLVLGVLNRLPAPPLDGGEAVRAALRAGLGLGRGDLWAGRVGIAAAAVLAAVALVFFHGDPFLILIAALAGWSSFQLVQQGRPFAGTPGPRPRGGGDDVRAWRMPREDLEAEIRRRRAADRQDREVRERLDRILKQINEDGIGSLSDRDREFLDETSRRLRGQGRQPDNPPEE